MSVNSQPKQHSAWYHEPMVWMIISIPLTSVLVGFGLLFMSIKSYDGLVVDDYYKRGKEINRILERENVAIDNDIVASIDLSARDYVDVEITHLDQFQLAHQIQFTLRHRTRMGQDRTVLLERRADGRYRGALSIPDNGVWLAQLETKHWLVEGYLDLPTRNLETIGFVN